MSAKGEREKLAEQYAFSQETFIDLHGSHWKEQREFAFVAGYDAAMGRIAELEGALRKCLGKFNAILDEPDRAPACSAQGVKFARQALKGGEDE